MKEKREPLLRVSITLSGTEKQRIDDAAYAARLPRAAFVRDVVLAHIESRNGTEVGS